MRHRLTLGIFVLTEQLPLRKFLIGKQLTIRLTLVCGAMAFVKMMEVRDRLF